MTSVTFDTHASIKNLISAGADERLAEAIVDEIKNGQGELATKADLNLAIELLRRDMIIWLGGIVITAVTIAAGVVVSLLKDFIALTMN